MMRHVIVMFSSGKKLQIPVACKKKGGELLDSLLYKERVVVRDNSDIVDTIVYTRNVDTAWYEDK